jgi:hypothetical protein
MGDLQRRAAGFELIPAHRDHGGRVVPRFTGFDAARGVTAASVGAGHQDRRDPFRRIAGEGTTGAGRLVIGVGVHRHQRQGPNNHDTTLRAQPRRLLAY